MRFNLLVASLFVPLVLGTPVNAQTPSRAQCQTLDDEVASIAMRIKGGGDPYAIETQIIETFEVNGLSRREALYTLVLMTSIGGWQNPEQWGIAAHVHCLNLDD